MYWIHPDFPDASQSFSNCLASMLRQYNKKNRPLVFVCIGTPSILGDCLGPVIGSILSVVPTSGNSIPADIYGTLDAPVHALNFQDTCREIKKRHQKLPPIGHLQITGVFQDIFTPAAGHQMARFSRCISQGILKLYPALQGPKQSDLIDVFQIPANGNTAGNPADLDSGRFD